MWYSVEASLADITCDSDGKISCFIGGSAYATLKTSQLAEASEESSLSAASRVTSKSGRKVASNDKASPEQRCGIPF